MLISPKTIRFLAITPALVGVFVLLLLIGNANRMVLGVSVGPVSIANMTLPEAENILEREVASFLLTPTTFTHATSGIATTPNELGIRVATKDALDAAWSIGRSGVIAIDITEQVGALITQPIVQLPIVEKSEQFEQSLLSLLSNIDQPATNADLVWNSKTGQYDETPSKIGRVVDRKPIRISVLNAAKDLTPLRNVSLVLIDDLPKITEEDLTDGLIVFDTILEQLPRTVVADTVRITLTRNTVGPWLRLISTDDAIGADFLISGVSAWLEDRIAGKVNRSAQNALFETDANGRVETFALAYDGQQLDMDSALNTLREELLSPSEDAEAIVLPVLVTQPALGNNAAEELGITELLAVGETQFTGSPANRRHNIAIGAAQYDGLLIKPGQEFSFNQFLGPVNASTGYKPELVIKPGGTVPEYGGGLCQVSTTAFQAAVRAGLKISQRRSHSYIVRYYGAPGFDATIYPPYTDLKFINDTPGHILVTTEIIGSTIRFSYYGTNDGRIIEIDGPHTLSLNADGSGSAVLSVKTIYADGREDTQVFKSYYKSPDLYPVAKRNPLE